MRGPFLVVAPLSVVMQWKREIHLWTDMDAIIYHGSQEDRDMLRRFEFKFQTPALKRSAGNKLEVVITTPETCIAPDGKGYRRELTRIRWDFMIIDEAHRIKNYDSKMATSLRSDFQFLNCLLLTGTPSAKQHR